MQFEIKEGEDRVEVCVDGYARIGIYLGLLGSPSRQEALEIAQHVVDNYTPKNNIEEVREKIAKGVREIRERIVHRGPDNL